METKGMVYIHLISHEKAQLKLCESSIDLIMICHDDVRV